MTQKLSLAMFAVLFAVAGVVGYRLIKADITAEAYRERLTQLSDDYEDLRENYNTAVTRTAVTELLVDEETVCVVVRTIDGRERKVMTPYAPGTQVYAEYMVIDGRLWIRRVFDDKTAPEKGVVIDPNLAEIDWDAPQVKVSKAVSRRLDPGRWVVSVTGDGSLGLAPSEAPVTLVPNPEVGEFEPSTEEPAKDIDKVGPADVLRHAVQGD